MLKTHLTFIEYLLDNHTRKCLICRLQLSILTCLQLMLHERFDSDKKTKRVISAQTIILYYRLLHPYSTHSGVMIIIPHADVGHAKCKKCLRKADDQPWNDIIKVEQTTMLFTHLEVKVTLYFKLYNKITYHLWEIISNC